MARSGRDTPKPKNDEKFTQVVDQRPLNQILPRSAESGNLSIPIRTIIYLEVGDADPHLVRQVSADILASFKNGHPHYLVPLRHGRTTSKIEFENEFLETVNKLCEIREIDGTPQIVLKEDAHQVEIIRQKM